MTDQPATEPARIDVPVTSLGRLRSIDDRLLAVELGRARALPHRWPLLERLGCETEHDHVGRTFGRLSQSVSWATSSPAAPSSSTTVAISGPVTSTGLK